MILASDRMRSWHPAILVAGFLIFGGSVTGCFGRRAELSSRPVVKVNETAMTAKDFAELLAYRLKDFDAVSVKDARILSRMREQIIRDFVVEILTRDWAQEKGLFVKSEDLDAEINKVRGNYPDDLAFRRALSEQGLTFEQWREKLRISLLQRLVVADLSKDLSAPKEVEIANYYNQNKDQFQLPERVKIRQIVLDSESNARRIYDELKKKKPLKDLAAKFSISPESDRGGELGWIAKGTMDLFDAAFNMRVGQTSDVVKSPYGYHIFEVLDKKKAGLEPLANVKTQIERTLREQAEQKMYSSWLDERLRAAHVYRDETLINSLSVETKED